jgi:hypothetical protein
MTNVPYIGLKHKQLQQGRNNQQQFHKYAMSKKVELWLSSSLNSTCCNKNNNKQGNDNLVLIGKFIFLRGRFEYVQALF